MRKTEGASGDGDEELDWRLVSSVLLFDIEAAVRKKLDQARSLGTQVTFKAVMWDKIKRVYMWETEVN